MIASGFGKLLEFGTPGLVVSLSRVCQDAAQHHVDVASHALFVAAHINVRTILNPFVAAETMTGHIVRISGGDLSYDSIDYNSIFAIGLMLFIMTLGLNVLSRRFVNRFREVYE